MSPEHAATTITPAPETEPELDDAGRAVPAGHEGDHALSNAPEPAGNPDTRVEEEDGSSVDLARMAWLATVLACTIAVVVLTLNGYYGYAGVTLAVALAAGINLF